MKRKTPQLTPELREALSKTVDVNGKKVRLFDTMACRYCGGVHAEACPRVKRIKFKTDSKPEEIEFAEAMTIDAIVKLRYTATAEQAKRIDHRKIRDALYAAGAHKVYKIEATVERETRARVEISDKLGELEALDLYLASQGVEEPMAGRVRERIGRYLQEVGS